MRLNSAEYYYSYNAQGDVIGLFDSTGTQVVSYSYDTWGKLVNISGSLASTVGVKNHYRYRGYRYDTETGLYYLQSRYYNPEWGRFINADDVSMLDNSGELLSNNLFAYCGNNPVNNVDPDGHFAQASAIALGACFGPVGLAVGITVAVVLTVAVAVKAKKCIEYYKEHDSNKSPSKRNDHENGQARKKKDNGGEKGDARRKPNPNKRKP